jgi:hypothetical protein
MNGTSFGGVFIVTLFVAFPLGTGWLTGFIYNVIVHDVADALVNPNWVAMVSMLSCMLFLFISIMLDDSTDSGRKLHASELLRRFLFIVVLPSVLGWLIGLFVDMYENGLDHALENPNIPATIGAIIYGLCLFCIIIHHDSKKGRPSIYYIKPEGHNPYYPSYVEDFIAEQFKDKVRLVAAVNIPHKLYVEGVMVFVERKAGIELSPEDINAACKKLEDPG